MSEEAPAEKLKRLLAERKAAREAQTEAKEETNTALDGSLLNISATGHRFRARSHPKPWL